MKRISASHLLRLVLAVLVSTMLLTACGTVKKFRQSKTFASTSDSTGSTLIQTSETKIFGDSLKGTSYVPDAPAKIDTANKEQVAQANRGDSVEAESKGIKIKIKTKPVYNQAGNKIGQRLEFEAVAKPTSMINQSSSHQMATTSKSSKAIINNNTKEKTINYIWITWLLVLIALIGFVLFRGWLRKLISK